MNVYRIYLLLIYSFLFSSFSNAQTDRWLSKLITSNASPLMLHILAYPDSFQYQIIYTQINRDANNIPHFSNYYLNVDRNLYFNPASTVKLPVVLTALEKLNSLKIKGVDKYSAMLTDSNFSGQTKV